MIPADIFCLADQDGRLLDPAVQATVLAKYSRSPLSAREILAKLSKEEADKFHEKWVIKYNHSSVAELANLPICFEGVSIIASKILEKLQRPGYSEKSTRYQKFSKESFITPPGASASMLQFVSRFYDAYDRLYPKVLRECAIKMEKDPDDPATLKDPIVKARAFDNVRYILPAGTGTNLAAVANLRDIRNLTVELLSHTNPEFQHIGQKLLTAVQNVVPVLMKHVEPNEFQFPIKNLGSLGDEFIADHPSPYVKISRPYLLPDPDLEQTAFESLVASWHYMSWEEFKNCMNQRPSMFEVPDIFKTIKITYEIMMDYGAFRDLQRHRRCEQYIEPLSTNYGYCTPVDIAENPELNNEYNEIMIQAAQYIDENVIYDTDLIQYIIPLGYLHRSQFQVDLKELYYIVELRTQPQGHISYRKIAYQMYELAKDRWPSLMQWCRAVKPDTIGDHR